MDTADPTQSLPQLLCRDACRRLPISAAGISLVNGDDGLAELTVGSDDRARELEELQFTLGEGPCREAFSSGRLVLHTDLGTQRWDQWPQYCARAYELGVRAVFSYPLRIGRIRLGVLDLYRDLPGSLEDWDVTLALSYAEATALILLHMQAQDASDRSLGAVGELRATQVEMAFDSHPEVHQATGMMSVQAGVSLADALVMLRSRAYADDVPLADLAHEVVSRRIVFS